METTNILHYEKVLIINSIFGLGNRLRAIASAYSICKSKHMKLIINWIPDCHCDCLIEDLVINIKDFAEIISVPIKIESLPGFKYYNYLETETGGIKDQYIGDNVHKLFIKSNCVLNNRDSNTHLQFFLQNLKWNDRINTIVNSVPHISNFIGLHIRMEGGKNFQNLEADDSKNWVAKETELLFKYREISHVDNFINQINNILHKNPEQKFFVATDMKSNYEKLLTIYGNDRIRFIQRNSFDRSKEQLYYAVADIILLSRCKQFYGSTWSSFSELVTNFQEQNIRQKNIFSDKFKINNISKQKNFFNQDRKDGNSIVCVSMNRTENVLKVLPSWLKINNCDEIVILDYGSVEKLSSILKNNGFNDAKIKIYRVENVKIWHLSKAYNFAIRLSSYKNIYKLDSDDICTPNIINNHPLSQSNVFYHGKWQDARNENEKQIAGKVFFTYDMFVKSNGYNENIVTYGWDDSNFYLRLSGICPCKSISVDNFEFINHGNDIRQKHCKNNALTPVQNIQLNRILCEEKKILLWNDKCLHSEFLKSNTENVFILNNSFHLTFDFINKETLRSVIQFCKNQWK